MKCLLYNIWFGEIPNYFAYHQMTCDKNADDFHWIVYTDQVSKTTKWSKSITAHPYSWDQLIEDFSKIDIQLEKPDTITRPVTKTIAQCRLFLPMLRSEPAPEYSHWGITEFDVIYGKLDKYFEDAHEHLVISGDPRAGCGPFSVFRKDCQELLKDYPNLKNEIEDNSFDSIETNDFLEFFEQHGSVKRTTGLQPIRDKYRHTAGHSAKWLNGKLVVVGSQGEFEGGFFHFGGQRKSGRFQVKGNPTKFWRVSGSGIERLDPDIKLL